MSDKYFELITPTTYGKSRFYRQCTFLPRIQMKELRQMAEDRGIKDYHKMTRAELVVALNNNKC